MRTFPSLDLQINMDQINAPRRLHREDPNDQLDDNNNNLPHNINDRVLNGIQEPLQGHEYFNIIPVRQDNRLPDRQDNRLPDQQDNRLPDQQDNRLPDQQDNRLPDRQDNRLPDRQDNRLPDVLDGMYDTIFSINNHNGIAQFANLAFDLVAPNQPIVTPRTRPADGHHHEAPFVPPAFNGIQWPQQGNGYFPDIPGVSTWLDNPNASGGTNFNMSYYVNNNRTAQFTSLAPNLAANLNLPGPSGLQLPALRLRGKVGRPCKPNKDHPKKTKRELVDKVLKGTKRRKKQDADNDTNALIPPPAGETSKPRRGRPPKVKKNVIEITLDEDLKDYHDLLTLGTADLVSNREPIICQLCFGDVIVGEGVILKDCLHSFCRKCLVNTVVHSETPQVRCPYVDYDYSCESHLQEREIKCLVSAEEYEVHLSRSVALAEAQADNSFHCRTPDCRGWCTFEDGVREFVCSACGCTNCLACGAIHEGFDCKEYLDSLVAAQSDDGETIGAAVDGDAERKTDYRDLLRMSCRGIVPNTEMFTCPVCFCEITAGEGVVLKECLHSCCKECLAGAIEHSDTVAIKCPFSNDDYSCDSYIQEREVKCLVTLKVYEKHLARSVALAESQAQNSFHCKTPDCPGWCLFEDDVNAFACQMCGHTSCLTCAAIHEGKNCRQYQDWLSFHCDTSEEARKTREYLEGMVKHKNAMECPTCQVILMKRDGCDWLKCSMCRTEICWVTRGPRWGPMGRGDKSGGCKCDFSQGKLCHPQCRNCH